MGNIGILMFLEAVKVSQYRYRISI